MSMKEALNLLADKLGKDYEHCDEHWQQYEMKGQYMAILFAAIRSLRVLATAYDHPLPHVPNVMEQQAAVPPPSEFEAGVLMHPMWTKVKKYLEWLHEGGLGKTFCGEKSQDLISTALVFAEQGAKAAKPAQKTPPVALGLPSLKPLIDRIEAEIRFHQGMAQYNGHYIGNLLRQILQQVKDMEKTAASTPQPQEEGVLEAARYWIKCLRGAYLTPGNGTEVHVNGRNWEKSALAGYILELLSDAETNRQGRLDHVRFLLRQALEHLDIHDQEYEHITPKELMEEIQKELNRPGCVPTVKGDRTQQVRLDRIAGLRAELAKLEEDDSNATF